MNALFKKYFLGIFIDLSKVFHTVDYKILIKLEKYGVCDKNLLWFKNYLSNRKKKLNIEMIPASRNLQIYCN